VTDQPVAETKSVATVLTERPLVSVIIPTYDRLDYLREAIASAVSQTYTNLEIIVADDCGPANSKEVVDSFQDSRIQYKRNPTNLGVSLNLARSFAAAKGKYVASLNDDDRWDQHFLETLIRPLEDNSELVLAFCDYFIIDDDGHINEAATQKQTQREGRAQLSEGIHQPFRKISVMDQAVFTAAAALIRKDAVNWAQISEAGVFYDYYIAYLASRSGQGAYYCPQRLSYYRIHATGENMISGKHSLPAKIRKGKAGAFCYEQFIEDPNLAAYRTYFQHEWAHANTTIGIAFLRMGDPQKARTYIHRALQYHRFNLRTLVAYSLSYLPQSLSHSWANVSNPGLFTRPR